MTAAEFAAFMKTDRANTKKFLDLAGAPMNKDYVPEK
jgi:hypothetical protein